MVSDAANAGQDCEAGAHGDKLFAPLLIEDERGALQVSLAGSEPHPRGQRSRMVLFGQSSPCVPLLALHDGQMTLQFDGVALDFLKQFRRSAAMLAPLERRHLYDLERVAGLSVHEYTKVVDLAMPLRDLTFSESYRGQLGCEAENLFGDAVRFSSRVVLARKGSVDKKQIDVAVGGSVAVGCGAEGARV